MGGVKRREQVGLRYGEEFHVEGKGRVREVVRESHWRGTFDFL